MTTRPRFALLPAAFAALAGVFFLVVTFFPALQNFRHGFPTYYVAARLVLEGRWSPQVYDNDWFIAEAQARTPNEVAEVFAPNPPSASLIMLPLAWLDISVARRVWLGLSLGLLLATVWLLGRGLAPGRWRLGAGIAALPFLFAPVHENFRLANVYGLLLFWFALALSGLRGGAVAGPGAALGLAAGTKLSGSPLWLLLVARGRWRALAVGTAVALGLAAVGAALVGLASWQRFVEVVIEHAREPGWAAGLAFQTTPSFFQHLFRPDAQWNPQPVWVLPAWVARVCTLAVSAAALGLTLWKARRADLTLAFAAALTLGVVLLPFAEEYHYTLLVLPLSVAMAQIGEQRRLGRGAWAWLGLAFVLLAVPWTYKDPWLNLGWHALLGYPRLYGGWLLWGWLMAAMKTAPSDTDDAGPEGAS